MQLMQKSHPNASGRTVLLHLVDATDGITAETGESGGQPQLSVNGGAFTNTSATLAAIGNGLYIVTLTAAEINQNGLAALRYKSAATAEFQTLIQIVGFDQHGASWVTPTTPGANLDISSAGNAGIDWANIDAPTTTQSFTGTTINSVSNVQLAVRVQSVTQAVGIDWALTQNKTSAAVLSGTTISTVTNAVVAYTVAAVSDKTGYSIGVGGIATTAFASGAIDAAAIAANAVGASELAQDAAQEIADEVLDRNLAGGGSGNTRNVRNALRALRNKVGESGGTLTVYQENDTDAAWTAAVTRTAGQDAITDVDPA